VQHRRHDHGTQHVRPPPGPWADESWTGWWGDDPPFHHPVFVVTHHPRPSITMAGGTTFHFVDGVEAARERALEAADGPDVRVGGGAAIIQQLLRARLIDDLHLAIVPILLRGGERLFDHLDGGQAGYEAVEFQPSPAVAHVRLSRSPASS